jgi:hypothetical protein
VFVARAENSQAKHFLSALHTTVFTAAFSGSYPNKDFRWVSLSNPTIFLRVCFPVLPTLFQVPPVYSRIHFTDSEEPFFSAVYTLPSRAQQYVCPSIPAPYPVFSILSTALITQSKSKGTERKKKKKKKVCCQEMR